jgi:DNA-binding GntR family transcriptional regulator
MSLPSNAATLDKSSQDRKAEAMEHPTQHPNNDQAILLPEMIYSRLRHEVLNGDLRPGQLLRQEELAQRFKVSRVPLREAMTRLEAEGLLVLRPRRGYAVMSLDQSDIVEIFELRMVIEEHAGYLAARARTQTDIQAVQHSLEQMENIEPVTPDHYGHWSKCNYEFHSRIIAASRRPRLLRIAGSLRDSVEPYVRIETGITGHVHDASHEHRDLFDAFRAGDADGLAALSKRHVQGTARRLLDGLRHAARHNIDLIFENVIAQRSAVLRDQVDGTVTA